jgi:hypothetical protein
LKSNQWHEWHSWALAAEIAILSWEVALLAGYKPEYCEEGGKACERLQDPVSLMRYPLVYALDWIEANDKIVVALAGLAVAIFTFTLWRSTHLLWRETRDAGETNKKIALAAERSAKAAIGIELPIIRQFDWPELVHLSKPVPEDRTYASLRVDGGRPQRYSTLHTIDVWNAGRTSAIATALRIGWDVCVRLPEEPRYRHTEGYPGGITIRAGQEGGAHALDPGRFTIELSDAEIADIASDKRWFWLFIDIEFVDFIQEVHHARMCWRWDTFGVNIGQYFPNVVDAPEAYTKQT